MTDLQQPLFLHMARRPFQRWPGSILLFTFILSAVLFLNPPRSDATLIEIASVDISAEISQSLSSLPENFEQSIPDISFQLSIEPENAESVELFSFTPGDINSDLELTLDQFSSNFNTVVSLLTDNDNNNIGYEFVTSLTDFSYGTSEAMLFYNDGTGNSGIDFSGFQIDKLCLSVTEFLAYTGVSSTGAQWFYASVDLSFNIYGSQETAPVPEPATALLMGTGFTILALRRRKLNK